MTHIAIFASGNGTNAENIIEYFKERKHISVTTVITDNKDAYVIERAHNHGVHVNIFERKYFRNTSSEKENQEFKYNLLHVLKKHKVDYIVLAGFLSLIPEWMIESFPFKIINIHPALLPRHGGKGMYGDKVHEAVIKNRDKITGITIHYVNAKYDDGDIIFQAVCNVESKDSVDAIRKKVHQLEYEHFPKVIDLLIKKNK